MRHVSRFAFATLLMLQAALAHAAPVTYTITSKLARVNLSIEHQGFIQLSGTLKITPGNFVFDNDDWSKSSVQVTMPTRTLDMGDAMWNQQLRGDESWQKLFKAPYISFRSTRLERSDATHGVLRGELTLAGVTKPVALMVRLNKIGRNQVNELPSIGFTATGTIKRSEFGLDAYLDLVGDELAVQIQMEAAVGPDKDAPHQAGASAQGVMAQ
ncbi:YceI family protein [Massilia sp. NR 4-1]|uniref:YceI family protein n=1 Tax=Massilia sp. NR 4-1 TaxID=1678028 RepID=UPI00067C70E0|nr:YceI family protein [Massilia sp. NR 4-1]